MKNWKWILIVSVLVLSQIMAACAPAAPTETQAPPATQEPTEAPAEPTVEPPLQRHLNQSISSFGHKQP